MNASLVLGCCLAAWNAGPAATLNQPAAAQARAVPSVVVPVGHVVLADAGLDIPPAPTPLFADGDTIQIEFEFSQPESCHDSDVFLPAPPAESELADPARRQSSSAAPAWRLRLPTLDIQPAAACDEPTPISPPAELQPAGDRLQHLRQAMQHLQAAGLSELAREASDAYLAALEQRRQHLQWELHQTTQELEQLTQELGQPQEERRTKIGDHWYRVREHECLPPPQVPGTEIAPSSNVVPFPPEPMSARPTPIKLINPSFYVGSAPAGVVEAWQHVFAPQGPRVLLRAARLHFDQGTEQPSRLLVPVPQPDLGPVRLSFPPSPAQRFTSPPANTVVPEPQVPEFELPPAPVPDARLEAESEPVA